MSAPPRPVGAAAAGRGGEPVRYVVIGNPVAHSRSPQIHAMFAEQTGEHIAYARLLAPLGGFAATVAQFRQAGGRGANVTLPFKVEAAAYATRLTPRAAAAGAVNTLAFDADDALGDNTDGAGLVADLTGRLGLTLAGTRVLVVGAGGAARGVLRPLLDAGVASLLIANRTAEKARALARQTGDARVGAAGLDAIGDLRADLVVNASSAGLDGGDAPALPTHVLAGARLAYDMVYGSRQTAFVRAALAAGCARASDGLGMLVEQAAESFLLWRGVRPATAPVYAALRASVDAGEGAHS